MHQRFDGVPNSLIQSGSPGHLGGSAGALLESLRIRLGVFKAGRVADLDFQV